MRPPCIHKVETTIRQDAFCSASNSLDINHREKDQPSLRPDGANKTPLHRFAKCPSMESMRTYAHRKSAYFEQKVHALGRTSRNCLRAIAFFVCGHS